MSVSQTQFRTAILDPDHPRPEGLSDGIGRAATKRFDVYRNNVVSSLRDAMKTSFPAITKLLGVENMDGLAGMYLRQFPPATPLMMQYGADFPAFLDGLPQLAHLGYLGDVARLELALRYAYHAADAAPIDAELLGLTAPEILLQTTLRLAPAVQVLRSDWPILDIWRFNMQPGAPKPRAGAQDVLITRAEFDPVPDLLGVGGADWIAALRAGHSFGQAHDSVLADHPTFDLGAVLGLLLAGNAITSLTTKD